ncbi:putative ABC transporter ATP-binding protein YheS [Anatilimnocola aggregata]|uniref:Putative ABC transporter ATP-binding protein YheS n=1 Tax=Anatilimnocola aggregata TaxID=2528021 RepID=A0A517YC02_9BACT|nr:ABC-F family ATP-binding cassette domain-containing protein [Anatilimnocola aggregata]QDU27741.1 putative ABC transporter ATP-binding protein YheS [Anatilimnocola aggregata]
MPASITLVDLAYSTSSGPLFSHLNLSFGPAKAGLVGRNGIGKTTLLQLIAGNLKPQTGKITVSGSFGCLRQTVQVNADQTVADLFGATSALAVLGRAERGEATDDELADADWTLETRMATALNRVGLRVQPDAHLTSMSGGQRTRASLAALIFSEPDFLLLDEPTNNLDRDGRSAVLELLSNWRAGAIVVSHDRELLETMDAIVELTTIGASRYGGNWSAYRAQKAQELAAAKRDLADAERRVSDASRYAQATTERQARRSSTGRKKGAKGGTPRILLGGMKDRSEKTTGENNRIADRIRDESRDALAIARGRVEVLQPLSVKLPPTCLPADKMVIRLNAVTAGYEPGRAIIQDFSMSIRGPERIAVAGPNGCGKSTLIALITGKLASWNGTVEVPVNFALLDQRVELLDRSASIRDNFLRINLHADENACRAALARFMFRAESALQIVSTLSGGQILRAGLACVLGGPMPPPLLVLDEPTNHLDIDSIESVEAGLRDYDGALLVASHDETFLNAIGITRRVDLRPFNTT